MIAVIRASFLQMVGPPSSQPYPRRDAVSGERYGYWGRFSKGELQPVRNRRSSAKVQMGLFFRFYKNFAKLLNCKYFQEIGFVLSNFKSAAGCRQEARVI